MDFNRLKQLVESATPTPWEQHYGYNNAGISTSFFKIPAHNLGKEVEMLTDDAEFIVEAREKVPLLLERLELLERNIEKYRSFCEELLQYAPPDVLINRTDDLRESSS